MGAINDNSFITVLPFMRNELHLRSNELFIYAIINGFSADGDSEFYGSASYIADWLGITRVSVMNNLAKLVEKGLIIKRVEYQAGVRRCFYRVSNRYTEGCKTAIHEHCKNSLQNNKVLKSKEEREGKKRGRFTPPTVEEMVKYMNESGHIVNAEKFIDFYGSKGWRVGNSPMKDWRAAVRNWERGQTEEQKESDRAWLAAWRKKHEPRKTNTGRWMLDGKQIDPPEGESGYRLDGTWVGEVDIQETSAPVVPPQQARRGMVSASDLFGEMFR